MNVKDFLLTVGAVATAILALISLAGIVIAWVKKPWKSWKTVQTQVATMAAALGPNGGKSLADSILRQERELERQGVEQNRIAGRVDVSLDMIERAVFETCDDGDWTRINRALEMAFGFGQSLVAGWGWVNLVHREDRDRVVREWRHAVDDQRIFVCDCRIVTRGGATVEVAIQATPRIMEVPTHVPGEHEPRMVGWFGFIDVVRAKAPGAAA